MRSRFSAFAVADADYLLATWHPATRPMSVDLDPAIEWRKLSIGDLKAGGEDDDEGTVQFVAHYWDTARRQYGRQQENSRFTHQGGQWLYVEPV
jgi:SEC-C motif-containing protein